MEGKLYLLNIRNISVSYANEKKDNNGRGGFNRGKDRSPERSRERSRDRSLERSRDRLRDRPFGNDNRSSGGQRYTVFVGNLGFKTSENSIRSFFKDCGNIDSVRIAKDADGKVLLIVYFRLKDFATLILTPRKLLITPFKNKESLLIIEISE